MKANELTIGQKYIWRRNSEISHEVIYLGCDDSGKYPMYEFEYLKEGEKMQTLLSVHQVDIDISLQKEMTEFQKNEVLKYNILREIYDSIDKSKLNSKVEKFELNLQTDSQNDTEIFIHYNRLTIYSFRVHHPIQEGNFFQRWHGTGRLYDKESVIQAIKDIVY